MKYPIKYSLSDEYLLVFFTGNVDKAREIKSVLGDEFPFLTVDIDTEEVQAVSVRKVATHKILESYNVLKDLVEKDMLMIQNGISSPLAGRKLIVAVEDTGLGFEDLGSYHDKGYESNWFPGALIKFYYKSFGKSDIANRKICKQIAHSKAEITTCISVMKNKEVETFCGKVSASVADAPRGVNGFDFDFILEIDGKTFGELSEQEKNDISSRGEALRKFRDFLREQSIRIASLPEDKYGDRVLRMK